MGPSGRITHVIGYIYWIILHCWDRIYRYCIWVELSVQKRLRTKETLPDFLKWRWVTRHPLVFRGLTGSQRTPGIGASHRYSH